MYKRQELGRINKDVEVRLETGDDGSPTLQAEVWRFNPQALEAVYGKMNQNPMVLSRWTDTELSGSITDVYKRQMQVPAAITRFLQLTSTLTASSTAQALSRCRCRAQRQS